MNNEPVTREEFDRLLGYANTLADLLREQNRIVGEHLANSGRLTNRLAAAERLLDGVKDAVCRLASHAEATNEALDGPKLDSFRVICDTIAKAQQPPATATGEPVVIVATESAGPSIARILARTNGVDATDANTSVGIDPAASAAAETNERATEGGGQ